MKPIWNPESDKIGGLREWAHENNHNGEKKTITVKCSKIWVYGSTEINHGDMLVSIDGKDYYANLNTTTRIDGALVYESDYMPLENHTFSFSQHIEDCVFNGFYYDPMPSPEPDPEYYILHDDNCNKKTRCEKKVNNFKENIQVYVDVTTFNDFKHNGNGGAICIENAALKVNKSTFSHCESNEGGGGAIYVHNTFEITNTYFLQNLFFEECVALYGGAVYLYASSMKIDATISNCEFRSNQAQGQKDAADNKFGGSAIYLSVHKGTVDDCHFHLNKGYGGACKIVNNFPKDDSTSDLLLLSESRQLAHVSRCSFETNKNDDCAIFYLRGFNGPQFEISNCKFTGKLAKNGHFIDGEVISKNSYELVVRGCSFESDLKKAFNLEVKNLFSSAELKHQTFENEKSENGKWKAVYTLVLPIIGALAVVALVLAIVLPRKLDKKEVLEAEIPTEMKDSLL